MVKFKTHEDKIQFLIEANRPDLINQELTEDQLRELWQGVVRRRRFLKKRLKDRKRSQVQKANWRKYRFKYLMAIRKWHRSIDGKRFHRALARFLALRHLTGESLFPSDRYELLKLISSLRTHWYIDGAYFRPLLEEIEYELATEELLPILNEIEEEVLSTGRLTSDSVEFLYCLLEGFRLIPISEILDIVINLTKSQLDNLKNKQSFIVNIGNEEWQVVFEPLPDYPGETIYKNNQIVISVTVPCVELVFLHELTHALQKHLNISYPYNEYQPRVADLLFGFELSKSDIIHVLELIKEDKLKDLCNFLLSKKRCDNAISQDCGVILFGEVNHNIPDTIVKQSIYQPCLILGAFYKNYQTIKKKLS